MMLEDATSISEDQQIVPINLRHRMPVFLSAASLVFAIAHLTYEHFSGGVQSHHLLNRSDLPAISNWFGLIILPLLGWLLGVRIRAHLASSTQPVLPAGVWIGLVGALLYGAALAASFELYASAISSGLFFGLFLLAAVLPIHRAECFLGFVVGMTFTFGAVLPTLIAAVFAAISIMVRFVFRAVASAVRPSTRLRDVA